VACYFEGRLQCLRSYAPGGWRPSIHLVGREHVERALAAGRGAILWVTPMAFNDLVTKMAFSAAGFRVSHLSETRHGLSSSRLGLRVLNPLWTGAEDRYLAERLVMTPGNRGTALRQLTRRVRASGLVSITVTAGGQRCRTVPFLNGTMSIADGAPMLAWRTGAALLPVFTVRGTDGTFVTTVEPPLTVATDNPREVAVQMVMVAYSRLLEWYVLRWPAQYHGWVDALGLASLETDQGVAANAR